MAKITIRLAGCLMGPGVKKSRLRIEENNQTAQGEAGQGETDPPQPRLLRRAYRCRFVRAGVPRGSGGAVGLIDLAAAALQQAVLGGLFDGRAVFIDHASSTSPAAGQAHPSLRNLVGVTDGSLWNEAGQCVEGVIRLYSSAVRLAELLDELLAEGEAAPDVGLSIVFWPLFARRQPADGPRRVVGIRHVESVDLVFEPAADGRLLQALSADGQIEAGEADARAPALRGRSIRPFRAQSAMPGGIRPAGEDIFNSGGATMDENQTRASEQIAPGPHNQPGAGLPGSPGLAPVVEPAALAAQDALLQNWLQGLAQSMAETMLNASSLPEASKQRLQGHPYATPQEVQEAITAERQYLAALSAENVVQIGGRAPRESRVSVGADGLGRLSLALEALLCGRSPGGEIPPLSGIREAYMLLSGDYELTGVFYPERVSLASVNSSTLAGLVANALNKSVVNAFQLYPRWWERFVTIEDFSNLQQVKWITLGGVGELPTVGEGASYSELTWDDQTETASFVKKGGYLGITLEAIDKDDTRKLQAAPRALAQAAWLTLARSISAIFTQSSGAGPTMSDAVALFHANHGNLGSTALSMSSFAAARTAMRKQTELNSSERLGALTAPRFLLVPPDLEITALQIMGSDLDYSYALSNGTAAPVNALGDDGSTRSGRLAVARERVVVVDLWTDSNDWAAAADPLLYPSIGLGFRYGRTPEIFSVASPTAGLMFSNDVMPVKVRFFYAVGPTDWRGLYKANVS